MADVLPPHSDEAERAFLGAALANEEVPGRWADGLNAGEFYIVKNGWVWEAVQWCVRQRMAVSLISVSERLEAQQRLEEIGGEAYLAQCTNTAPSFLEDHADTMVRLIKNFAVRRRMIRAAGDIAKLAFDQAAEIDTVMAKATGALSAAIANDLRGKPVLMGQVVHERVDRLQRIWNGELSAAGLSTGLVDLDKLTGGLFPGDSILIAARPRIGKSGLLAFVADVVSRLKKCDVLVFSLEMTKETWADRLLASVAQVDHTRIRTGLRDAEEWDRVYQAETALQTRCWIDDTPGMTDATLRTKARQLHAEVGLDLIVLDYLQKAQSAVHTGSRYQDVGLVSSSVKDMAKELNVPVISAAMVGRGVEAQADKRPGLADLRESGNLEADADLVAFLHREEVYNPETDKKGVAEIIVDKNRNGPMGTVHVGYDPVRQYFYNLERKVGIG